MPCNTSQGEDDWFEEKYGTNNPDKLRGMLCKVLTSIQFQKPDFIIEPEILDWFEKHKRWDIERKKLGL